MCAVQVDSGFAAVRYCPDSGHFPGNGAVVVKPDGFWGFDRSCNVFSVLDEFVGSGCGGCRYVCIRFSRVAVRRCNGLSVFVHVQPMHSDFVLFASVRETGVENEV